MEYCYHVLARARSYYMNILDKLQKNVCGAVHPSIPASLEPLALHQNIARPSIFYRYYFVRCSFELAELVPLLYPRGRPTRYSNRMHGFSVTNHRCYNDVYVNNFFLRTV